MPMWFHGRCPAAVSLMYSFRRRSLARFSIRSCNRERRSFPRCAAVAQDIIVINPIPRGAVGCPLFDALSIQGLPDTRPTFGCSRFFVVALYPVRVPMRSYCRCPADVYAMRPRYRHPPSLSSMHSSSSLPLLFSLRIRLFATVTVSPLFSVCYRSCVAAFEPAGGVDGCAVSVSGVGLRLQVVGSLCHCVLHERRVRSYDNDLAD